jgi:UMF1 family MFS transporter
MLLWGLGGPALSLLLCFFVANLAYQTALLFYNALLPSIAAPERTGFWSGLGTGFGYGGNLVVLAGLILLRPADLARVEPYFVGAALGFLLFALPCLLLVRDRRPPLAADRGAAALRQSLRALLGTLRELPRQRALLFFLLGNFCLVDVLNTAIQFFGDYVKEVFRASYERHELSLFGHPFAPTAASPDGMLVAFLGVLGLLLSVLAMLFGILFGFWTDRHPLRVMRTAGIALGIGLLGGALFGGGNTTLFVLTLIVGGALGLAGIWTAGRKVVLLLAPPGQVGQYFGLYGITVKVSVLGSTVYGVIADRGGPHTALLAQTVPLLLGLLFLGLVRLPPTTGTPAPAAAR